MIVTSAALLLFAGLAVPDAGIERPAAGYTQPRTVEITGTDDMKYSVTQIDAKPGETLRIVLKSVGKMPKTVMAHNFILLKPEADVETFVSEAAMARGTEFIPPKRKGDIIASTKLAGNGETVEVTFTVPKKPGEYTYICSFPGHALAGMRGVLTVKP